MLVAILQNLLDSWAAFEALSFAQVSTLTLTTIKQFEDFALSIVHSDYDVNVAAELKSLAVSLLFAIGVQRGSVQILSRVALFLMNLKIKLDSRVDRLVKQLASIQAKYAMNFPQKLVSTYGVLVDRVHR